MTDQIRSSTERYRPINPNHLAVGDRVALTGWGGEVRLIDVREQGVVVRLNRTGHPVICIEDHSQEIGSRILTDRYGCAVNSSLKQKGAHD